MKGALTATSLPEAIEQAAKINSSCPIYILGGSSIYEEALRDARCKHAIITHLLDHTPMPCNVHFPSHALSGWKKHNASKQIYQLIMHLLSERTKMGEEYMIDGNDLHYEVIIYEK